MITIFLWKKSNFNSNAAFIRVKDGHRTSFVLMYVSCTWTLTKGQILGSDLIINIKYISKYPINY